MDDSNPERFHDSRNEFDSDVGIALGDDPYFRSQSAVAGSPEVLTNTAGQRQILLVKLAHTHRVSGEISW